jgi:hypothetical protein
VRGDALPLTIKPIVREKPWPAFQRRESRVLTPDGPLLVNARAHSPVLRGDARIANALMLGLGAALAMRWDAVSADGEPRRT